MRIFMVIKEGVREVLGSGNRFGKLVDYSIQKR